MSKFTFILMSMLLLMVSFILLLQIDDDLDPQAQNMYEQANAANESKAYQYLLGMVAAVDEDPAVVGKSLMTATRKAEESYFANDDNNQTFEFIDYPKSKKLTLPKLGKCRYDEKNCNYIDKLFSYPYKSQLSAEQTTLLKRYKALIVLEDFNTLSRPLIETIFPPFQYMLEGNSLSSLDAIDKAKNGNVQEAKKILLGDISSLRIQLRQADTLVTKMVYSSAISRTLDVLSILIHKSDSTSVEAIPLLTSDERSLVKAMNYEFATAYNMVKKLDKSPTLFHQDGKLPGWVSRMLFKPNMTLNIIFPSFRQVGQDSLLSSKEFAVKASRKKLELRKNDKFRNYVGYTLSQVAIADHHDEFISRVFQLDAKIHLFNKILNKGALPQTLSHINNPFYDDKTAYYSDDTKAICIDAPMQRKRKADHCLRVK